MSTGREKGNIEKMKMVLIGLGVIWILVPDVKAAGAEMGFFVEPGITYEIGDASINYPSPISSSSGKIDGFGLGARVGMHLYEAFFLGLDGRFAMPRFKDSSVDYDTGSISTNLGPVVGMQMPYVGMRIWGSYIFLGDLNPESTGNIDVKFENATGFRIGAGVRVTVVSLNLEYEQLKYGKTTLEQVGPFSPGTAFDSVTLENKAWIASVSFPLEL